ncbi:hypothetical protein RR42_m4181 [Cupriavidus basilensis]|uniref:Uncharacterized protein n=1 Tax=Cupriavidus basilensis TaxID=68895 RepID=A0A0C4YF78_9BURK|nr:hypothetical protein RR42_m4181 [Cupriavidus basilensis]
MPAAAGAGSKGGRLGGVPWWRRAEGWVAGWSLPCLRRRPVSLARSGSGRRRRAMQTA